LGLLYIVLLRVGKGYPKVFPLIQMNTEDGWFWGKMFFISILAVIIGVAIGEVYAPLPTWAKITISVFCGIFIVGILFA
jgi:hypothetical protein